MGKRKGTLLHPRERAQRKKSRQRKKQWRRPSRSLLDDIRAWYPYGAVVTQEEENQRLFTPPNPVLCYARLLAVDGLLLEEEEAGRFPVQGDSVTCRTWNPSSCRGSSDGRLAAPARPRKPLPSLRCGVFCRRLACGDDDEEGDGEGGGRRCADPGRDTAFEPAAFEPAALELPSAVVDLRVGAEWSPEALGVRRVPPPWRGAAPDPAPAPAP